MMMLERGLQTVGALQDVRSELSKLRGVLFYKILEDLHAHLYNKVLQAQLRWRMMMTFPPSFLLHLLHIIHNLCLEEQGHSKVTIRLASRLTEVLLMAMMRKTLWIQVKKLL
jgi:hypothetical protein